jgi:hypothetical protein
VKKEDMDTCERFIGGLHEKLDGLLTNNSKHNTKLKYMRLPSEAGRERRVRKSVEGRCQDNAIRVAVNILPTHTAACNICGIMQGKWSVM